MEASFWTTVETHPQQAPLGIINMLISRRALVDSISRSLEVLFEMPYTTDFPPGGTRKSVHLCHVHYLQDRRRVYDGYMKGTVTDRWHTGCNPIRKPVSKGT